MTGKYSAGTNVSFNICIKGKEISKILPKLWFFINLTVHITCIT